MQAGQCLKQLWMFYAWCPLSLMLVKAVTDADKGRKVMGGTMMEEFLCCAQVPCASSSQPAYTCSAQKACTAETISYGWMVSRAGWSNVKWLSDRSSQRAAMRVQYTAWHIGLVPLHGAVQGMAHRPRSLAWCSTRHGASASFPCMVQYKAWRIGLVPLFVNDGNVEICLLISVAWTQGPRCPH